MSEVSHREWENAGYVPNDMRCALPQTRSVVNDLKRLRPSAWVYWQAVEPLQFCLWYHFTYGLLQAAADAPVEYEGRTLRPGQFVVSKAFWAMMQFSRFIRPGDRILQTDDFWTVAALSPNGKRLTLIVHNDEKAGRELQFDLRAHGGGARTVRAWRTMDVGGLLWNCDPCRRRHQGRPADRGDTSAFRDDVCYRDRVPKGSLATPARRQDPSRLASNRAS